jgi:hypothetical protein
MVLSHQGFRELCSLVDSVLEQYQARTEKLKEGVIVSEGDYKVVVDPNRSVFMSVTNVLGQELIHICRYLRQEPSKNAYKHPKAVPNSFRLRTVWWLHQIDLIDLKNRVAPGNSNTMVLRNTYQGFIAYSGCILMRCELWLPPVLSSLHAWLLWVSFLIQIWWVRVWYLVRVHSRVRLWHNKRPSHFVCVGCWDFE